MDSCYSGWTSVRPESDAESFAQLSKERQELFERVAGPSGSIEVNPVLWAFLQIADIDEAKEQMKSERATNTMLLTYASAVDAVRLWKQHSEAKNKTANSISSTQTFASNPTSPSPLLPITTTIDDSRTRSKRKRGGQESSLGRSRLCAARCKERDGDFCAVSRMRAIDAAHIYPWCAFGDKGIERVKQFWNVLRMFWKEEVVKKWYSKIFVDENTPYRGTETVANMISLTSTLHRFHSDGAFALRPIQISDDKKQLELEFHWLVMEDRKPDTNINLLDRPQSSQSRTESGHGYGPFIRHESAADSGFILLESGTRFTMSTGDPDNKPLPDPGLLALQWHLQRVLAMSGAAGWRDEDFENDDDDDDAAGGLSSRHIESWRRGLSDPATDHQQAQSPPASESQDGEDGASG